MKQAADENRINDGVFPSLAIRAAFQMWFACVDRSDETLASLLANMQASYTKDSSESLPLRRK
jgi:hypothetical protein